MADSITHGARSTANLGHFSLVNQLVDLVRNGTARIVIVSRKELSRRLHGRGIAVSSLHPTTRGAGLRNQRQRLGECARRHK
jgi:hypothetical protein